jgi:uncharacterized damage-inducible protein DinB
MERDRGARDHQLELIGLRGGACGLAMREIDRRRQEEHGSEQETAPGMHGRIIVGARVNAQGREVSPSQSVAPRSGFTLILEVAPMELTPELARLKRDMLLEILASEDPAMLSIAKACPEDQVAWTPDDPRLMPFGKLVLHAGGAGWFWLQIVQGKAPKAGEAVQPATKAELVRKLETMQQRIYEGVSELTDDQLTGLAEFASMKLPGIDLLMMHPWHMCHHRGQLTIYLRQMGARVPSVYGPTAEDRTGDVV